MKHTPIPLAEMGGASVHSRRARPAVGVFAVIAIAMAMSLLAGLTAVGLRAAEALRRNWPPETDVSYLPPAAFLRFASLGHTEMAADLVAARANVYFGSQTVTRGQYQYLGQYLETAVALDPRFHRLYLAGAAMLVYAGKEITVDALLTANRLLQEGARHFPDDWELFFQRGFNLLFELPHVAGENDPRAAFWRQQGVEALRQATLLDGVPPWLPGLAARMLTQEGGEELAIHHLEQAYAATSNEETRTEIGRRLAAMHSRVAADALSAEAEQLHRLSASYPYAPEAFAIIAGPRIQPGIDQKSVLQPVSGSP